MDKRGNIISRMIIKLSIPFGGKADLRGHAGFELVVSNLQECQKFASEDANVRLVDQREGKFKSTATNGDVGITEAVQDNVAMALNSIHIQRDRLVEGGQGDVSIKVIFQM